MFPQRKPPESAKAPEAFRWACRIVGIEVRPDRMIAYVEVSDERFCFATPALIADLLPRFPNILSHTCVNERGETFMSVAANTSIPHVLEHLVIDEQARLDESTSKVVFVGKTAWSNRPERKACVQVSYADEHIARQALAVAQRVLNDALLARVR